MFIRLAQVLSGLLILTTAFSAAPADSRVANAAMDGDIAAVQSLLKQGVPVDDAQGDGMTALHWAAQRGDLAMTKLLLASKANVNATTRLNAVTPLFMAARKGNAAIIQELLNSGASVDTASTVGTTALMVAAASGNPDAVRFLLDGGADPNAKDVNQGQTAIMFAAASGRPDIVRVLADRGANLHARSLVPTRMAKNAKPAFAPVVNGQPTQLGGFPGRSAAPEKPLAVGGMSAMHFAAREGYIDTVRALIENGADVNLPTASDQMTPLLLAIVNGRFDIAKYLLEHGADPKPASNEEATALFTAIDVKWAPLGWYPAPKLDNENTDYLDLMKLLIEKGADVNARMNGRMWMRIVGPGGGPVYTGETPFIRAAQANDVEAVKLLLAHGANPSIPTTKGVTALMLAAGMGLRPSEGHVKPDSRLETVRFLVEELGADVNAKDNDGFTPLHGAASVGDTDVITYLVSRGADVKARANVFAERNTSNGKPLKPGTGESVADMANGPGEKTLVYPEIVNLLMKLGSEFSDNCRSALCVNKSRDTGEPKKPDEHLR